MIAVKNFPFFAPKLKSLDKQSEKICLTEFSGVPAYLPLQKAGHTVTEARDGREALERWEQGEFDMVLMDVQMPVMNGVEATLAIRERERSTGGHIPIIAVTARAFPAEREHIQSQGFDGYVTKPFEITALLGEIKRCLER